MKSAATGLLCLAAVLLSVVIDGDAQERRAADPRIGLKGGLRDAEQAARNMQLVASLPKPEGFFDSKAPTGTPTPKERDPNAPRKDPPPFDPKVANRLSFTNSDLAFSENHLFVGNYHGFNTYDIEDAKRPRLLVSVVCPGGQGDVSVHGHLLFMSVEQIRGRVDCGTQGVPTAVSSERFRGVRIFDISDLGAPRQVAAVQTCRGSHTHTLVTDPNDNANVYIYGSGTGAVRSAEELVGCSGLKPEEDPDTALFSIDVIQVPLDAPQQARIVNRPRIFSDRATGAISGLWPGGSHGPGTQTTRVTDRCHDITVFPEIGLAAGACSGNGVLLDISDPVNPVRLDQVADKNFAFWHSATFNNDGSKVIFTDEWGGGSRPRCRETDLPTWGANAIFDISDRKMRFASYYKLPVPQTDLENCVAHNGSLIPVPGRDIMVQAWYQGGISIFDFTDSARPVEIAFFDRGPVDATQLFMAGFWSAYWHNGYIYGSEIVRGIDVFRLRPSEHLSQDEIDAATLVRVDRFNPQQQSRFTWPASAVVARAYLDQLARTNAILPARATAVKATLDQVTRRRRGRDADAAARLDRLDALATQLASDAGPATATDASRFRALAATLQGMAAALR